MQKFKTKANVCAVPPEVVASYRAKHPASLIGQPWWRQVTIEASPEMLEVTLDSITEDVALGGYCQCWYNSRKFKLAWDDLLDAEGVSRHFQYEPTVVYQLAAQMLSVLRDNMSELRASLRTINAAETLILQR